jgi:hypothetical protein
LDFVYFRRLYTGQRVASKVQNRGVTITTKFFFSFTKESKSPERKQEY